MAELKPWEEYQAAQTQAPGPWTEYQTSAPTKTEEKPGLITRALEKLDAYTGAPVRKAVGTLQDEAAKGDESFGAVGRALKAGYHQMGAPVSEAPTPVDIINKDRFVGSIVNNPQFQESFRDTPQGLSARLLAAPFVGWDKSGELAGKLPKAAAVAITGAALDPVSHVPVGLLGRGAVSAVEKVPSGAKVVAAGEKLADAKDVVASKLGKTAEKFAERATGATGRQLEDLKPGTGRELLDRGLIRFGQSTEGLAKTSRKEMTRAGQEIGDVLKSLDASGAEGLPKSDVVSQIRSKIAEFGKRSDTRQTAREMQQILDRDFLTQETPEVSSLIQGNLEKGGWQNRGNYSNPALDKAEKEIASILQNTMERQVTRASKPAGELYKKEKETYGLLKPVVDAAEKRAAQMQQRPIGGLSDIASSAGGAILGTSVPTKIATGVGGFLANRILTPRATSSAAVLSELLAKRLRDAGATPKQIEAVVRLAPGLLTSVPKGQDRR